MNFNSTSQKERYTLHMQIQSLLADLRSCAPHPSQKNTETPYYLNAHHAFTTPDAEGGMLGSMIIESALGSAFNDVANDMPVSCIPHTDFDKIGEAFSQYMSETDEDEKKGKGTHALYEQRPIANDFNTNSTGIYAQAMQDFLKDLPKRHEIENTLSGLIRELDQLDSHMSAELDFAA